MPYRQRGVVGIISVLVLIVVIALMVEVISDRATISLIDSSLQDNAFEAELLAESGVERAAWRYLNQEVYCDANGLGETNVEMIAGSGNTVTLASYNTDVLGNPLGLGQCRIVATATMASNGISRTINAIIFGSVLIEELFPDIAKWSTAGPTGDTFFTNCAESTSVTAQANDGTVTFDAIEDNTGNGGGSIKVSTPNGGSLAQTGYRSYTSAKAAYPGAVMSGSVDFKKDVGKKVSKFVLAIDLVSTPATGSTVYRVWCESSTRDLTWRTNTFSFTVPAGKYVDTVRISYHILNDSKASALGNSGWLDNIFISYF
jgi:hypothetical protein